MWIQGNGMGSRMLLALACVVALAGAALATEVRQQALSPTAHAPKARGRAKLMLKSASSARLKIATQRLPRNATFDVVADGVKVATLSTNGGGNGKVRLSTTPRGRERMLGFDPRGVALAVRDEHGDDVLECHMPDDRDPGDVSCCVPEDHGTECEARTPDECAAKGGTVVAGDACIPDPCGAPPADEVTCCLTDSASGAFCDDDPEVECEHRTAAECAAAGGTVVDAKSCEPNPCKPVPPPDVVVCCVSEPDEGEVECETLTAEHCAAAQGTVSTATSCHPNPCGCHDDGEHHDEQQGDQRHHDDHHSDHHHSGCHH